MMAATRIGRGALLALLLSLRPASAQVPSTPAPPAVPAPAPVPPASQTAGSIEYNSRQWRLERIDANHLRLVGQVEVTSGKLEFFADQVDIYSDTHLMVATGNVVFVNEGNRIAAERMEFDLKQEVGTFYDASGIATLQPKPNRATMGGQDADVMFYGRTIEKVGARRYRLTDGAFTTCVQPTPRWEMTSGAITLTLEEHAVATNMVFRVKGVPLFYFPALYYPINKQERATGILMPTYGTSTVRGQSISNAFFWAISRSADATVFHDWFSRTGQGIGSEYRYVTGAPASHGTVRAYFFNQKQATYTVGTSTNVLPASHSFDVAADVAQTFGAGLRGRARIDYFSDIQSHQLYQANIYDASRAQRLLSGTFSGAWGRYDTSVSVQRSEVFSSKTSSFLYGSSPRVSANIAPTRLFGSDVYAGVTSEFSNQVYQQVNGTTRVDRGLERFDLYPQLRMPISRWPFLTINTSAGLRTTYYTKSLDAKGVEVAEPVTRRYLQARAELVGPVFVKMWDTPESTHVDRRKHVVEPAVAFDYTSHFDSFSRVVVLDSSDNAAPGNTRVTYGITNRFLNRERGQDGRAGQSREFFTIGVQQSYYTSASAAQYDTSYTSLYRGRPLSNVSPVAVTTRAALSTTVDANGRLEYDVQGLGLQTITAGGAVSMPSNGSSGTISYNWRRLLPGSPAQAYLMGSANIRALERHVGGTYTLSYDIGRSLLISQQIVGFYNAQCCGFAVQFQKMQFPQVAGFPVPGDTRFNFAITLAGLGTFSNFYGAMSGIPR